MEEITRGMMTTEIDPSNGKKNSGGQWDFEAPMYVDFATIAKPGTIDLDYEIDDSSYFSIDHECHRGVSLDSEFCQSSKPSVIPTLFYGNDGIKDAGSNGSSGTSSMSDQHSPPLSYSTYHSSPNLKFGRCMDVIADVPQNRLLPCKQPDIVLSPSKYLDCSSDDDDNVVNTGAAGAVTGTWSVVPEGIKPLCAGRPPMVPRSPVQERGRQRFVAAVTSAKKRLSMSVDRGHKKLYEMKKSLAEVVNDILPSKENKSNKMAEAGKQTRFGSTEDLSDRMTGHSRRRILSGTDSLPKMDAAMAEESNSGAESESSKTKQKSVNFRRSVNTYRAEDIVTSLTRLNEAAVTENIHQNKISVPHSGIPFSEMATRLTVVKPFSFWARDCELVEKRQRRKLQVIAEEKKAREFHAQPFPDIIFRPAKTGAHNLNHSISSKASSSSGAQAPMNTFKARPPTVLNKPPFIPQKSNKPTTEILKKFDASYTGRTEKIRALEAARRSRLAREEEERMEREKQRREAELTEMKRLRMQTVHRAQPMPSYRRAGSSRQSSAAASTRTTPVPANDVAAADVTALSGAAAAANAQPGAATEK